MIFVFGSNESGIHGAGAARYAKDYKGAVYAVGFGPAGDSWAIPTKDWIIKSLPLDVIRNYVNRFMAYAELNPNTEFQVTRIGCGLAGFTNAQIAPMFVHAPKNCFFDTAWTLWLPEGTQYWGTN